MTTKKAPRRKASKRAKRQSEPIPGLATWEEQKHWKRYRSGQLPTGPASDAVSVDRNSPEFAEIAARYGAKVDDKS